MIKIIFFGDIVGKAGRQAVAKLLPDLRKKYAPDLVIANAENLAHGKGVTLKTMASMLEAGVDFFTSGNHVFDKPEAKEVFSVHADQIIRPANLSDDLPGAGWKVLDIKGVKVLIINLLGVVFMEKQFDYGEISNPFLALNTILNDPKAQDIKVRILDFHAEATSEKRGMGLWADGRMSLVVGTHTHVPSADAQILPEGTGHQTDIGMVGSAHSIIGFSSESVLRRFQAGEDSVQKPPLEIAESPQVEVGFVVAEIDEATGKCKNIESGREIAEI